MKKTYGTLMGVALCGLLGGSCGGGESVCEKADDVRAAAFDEACAEKGDECCICKCWKDGNQEMAVETPCSCKEQPGGACTGDLKAAAKNCLEDSNKCRQDVKDLIEMTCPGLP